jgi:hypothetical protein
VSYSAVPDIPHCRSCDRELLPLHSTLHRWWCTNQDCWRFHDLQHLRLPQHVRMADIRNRLAARIAQLSLDRL